VDRLLAAKSEDVGLIVSAISFQGFQHMWSQFNSPTLQTYRRTGDTRPQDRALHYSALRSKN